MSGGFFRGTSADQDTRFSNKQAKLLKSQKFPPELENLVDMTKVKMDVMRPWIAKRVTELIGFEDEVLINFIYGLLEGKAVNGKQVQISLTGFMERNTGKFMKELWVLLLSAQQNVSGVPQQFLDEKEEETKKKKVETDRIANEIQRKREKEKEEFVQEKTEMDGDGAVSRVKQIALELNVKHDAGGSGKPADEKDRYKRNGHRRHNRGSQSPDLSRRPLRQRRSTSPSKSPNLRSYPERRSRSGSRSPPSRSRSISLERRRISSPRRSMTPRRRHVIRHSTSPGRRSFHAKRRSTSRSRRRSPSPARYRVRSPRRHRSRSPMLRRRRSPVRHRSRTPLRRRSPSPIRRRSPSPIQSRSPSPIRRRSPSLGRRRSRSPLRRHSPPSRRQSPSPARRRYHRSPSTPRQRSISPIRRRSSMYARKRSSTPVRRRSSQESSSPSHIHRSSPSPLGRGSLKSERLTIESPEERTRRHGKNSPAHRAAPDDRAKISIDSRKGRSVEHRPVVSLRSPQRDMQYRNETLGKEQDSSSIQKSPSVSDASRSRSYSAERRSSSPRGKPYGGRGGTSLPESPNKMQKDAGNKPSRDSSGTSADDENNFSTREMAEYKSRSSRRRSPTPVSRKDSRDRAEIHGTADGTRARKSRLPNSDSQLDVEEYDEHRERQVLSRTSKTSGLGGKGRESYNDDGVRAKDKKIVRPDDSRGGLGVLDMAASPILRGQSEKNDHNGSLNSLSKETDEKKVKIKEKRKHNKLDGQEVESDDYSSYDSHEERKEAKRRRKEEKKMKKEERRQRREEKRSRRRVDKRSSKLGDSGSLSSDVARDHSEDEGVRQQGSQASNIRETVSEQKKLEIELREKALESLRAKKGFGK